MTRILALTLLLLVATPALAYIGPGAGLPVLGSLIAIVATVVLAIGAILMWPIRKMMKKKKAESGPESS